MPQFNTTDWQQQLTFRIAQLKWESRRILAQFNRRFGVLGWISFAALLLCLVVAWHESHLDRSNNALRSQIVALENQKKLTQGMEEPTLEETKVNGHTRLNEFDANLLPHKNIPELINFILLKAEEEGLTVNNADYHPEIDEAGGFIRMRINLPIKGSAEGIDRFLIALLHTHTALTVNSVQFKRESPGAQTLELQTQWIAFTQLPNNELGSVELVEAQGGVKP